VEFKKLIRDFANSVIFAFELIELNTAIKETTNNN